MKKLLFIVIVALVAINIWLYAQEKDTVQAEPEIKLELVWEREFEEPVIDFTIGTTKDGEPYPDVVVLGSQLGSKALILDSKEKKLSDLKGLEEGFNFFGISESKNHIIHSWWRHDKEGKEVEECIVYIYDLQGKLLWKTPNIAPTRYPLLSPNGEYLIGPSWAEVLLVKKDGTIKLINPRQNKRRALMRIFFAVSGNSEFWAINFGEPYADESVQVVTYDPYGVELFRKAMEPMGLAYGIAISKNGEMIGVVSPNKKNNFFNLFDKKGNILWTAKGLSSMAEQWIVFSPLDNYVLVTSLGGNLKYFDVSTGQLNWEYSIPKEEISVNQDPGIGFIPHMEIAFSSDENLVVVSGEYKKTNRNCLLVFEKGHGLVSTYSLSPSNRGFLPKTKFTLNGDFYVSNGKKLLKFALRRSK